MVIYPLLLVLSLICAVQVPLEQPNRSIQPFLFAVVAITLVFGLRVDVGADYFNYIDIYERVGRGERSPRGIETGYFFLNYLLNAFRLPAESAIFVSFAGTFAMLYSATRKWSKNVAISLIVLLAFGVIFSSTNLVRQSIAFAICTLTLGYIRDRRLFMFLLTMGIAFLFHRSALLFLPAYFITRYRIPMTAWLVFSLAALLINLNLARFLAIFLETIGQHVPFYSHYADQLAGFETSALGMGLRVKAEYVAVIFVVIFLYRRIASDTLQRIIVNLFLMGTLLNFAFGDVLYFQRFVRYFYDFGFLAWPAILTAIHDKKLRELAYVGFVIYCFLLVFRVVLSTSAHVMPYQFVLFS